MKKRAVLLSEWEDCNEAHQELERVIASGEHPEAECRNSNRGVTEVWSGPAESGAD